MRTPKADPRADGSRIFERDKVWFLVGSQRLYGRETLETVEADARTIVTYLNDRARLPVEIVLKPVLTDSKPIATSLLAATSDQECVGVIAWMHTFSPARMWIKGLQLLQKPFLQLHTQFNRDIPWETIDMDYMNIHQTAHGGREFGFIGARLSQERKVVVGHWTDDEVARSIGVWMRAAAALRDARSARIARFGDNMRRVAVTEGNKVSAEVTIGTEVDGFGVGDLVERIRGINDEEVDSLIDDYQASYVVAPELLPGGGRHPSLRDAARIEAGLRHFLVDGDFQGFTTTFEDLHGLTQLPGIAAQRLMADGYGFGAEGDWKTALLGRVLKTMARGLPGGTSFMEDYTYHLEPGRQRVLGAHMLEVCPSIAARTPRVEIHPLSIGGKADPVRLVFDAKPGPAINVSLIDLVGRLRLVANTVEVVEPDQPLVSLPVPRAVWIPDPDLPTAAAAWIQTGGAHHTVLSTAIGSEHIQDFANMIGVECIRIDAESTVSQIQERLRWNSVFYKLGS